MRARWLYVVTMTLVAGIACAQEATGLKTEKDRLSYALGMDLGGQFKSRSVDIDPEIFARGLRAALAGDKTLLTELEAKAIITELQKVMIVRQAEAVRLAGEKNKQEGEAFLAANKAKPGVVALPSGLQYQVLRAGDGRRPTIDDSVVCQYRGTLVDGTEFDSSYGRGEAPTLPVKGLVKGWTEALQLMPVGSKWRLVVPPQLGYGERGAAGRIGPNATLVFEVELLAIK